MTITLTDGRYIEYTLGAHYAYVFTTDSFGREIELEPFSFAWHKNKTNQLDFTNALEQWLAGE